ncbi:jacalin-like lectin [Vallitalea guaymasensis]|uniref:jacalin-like lectin n=1 Tax=Vallitalea guaymasensis TaxID=1185412 RepID=UPI00272A6DAC|nr:jacalin-like lectin [Vallitalea guaymasensis]
MLKDMIKKVSVLFICMTIIFSTTSIYTLAESNDDNRITILTYNIAGLPALLSSADPEKNTKRIGELINNFDIVAVQEDFAYHDDLLSESQFSYVTDHPGNVPFGSGLNVLSNYPIKESINIPWDMTHGNITCPPPGYHGADEMTPKGFSYQRIELEPGVIVDLYNLHADAGGDEGSREARHDNFIQLAEYINNHSSGNAIILLGDTNAFYTRECDNLYENLTTECGLTDPWIEFVRNGEVPEFRDYHDTMEDLNEDLSGPNYETIDKIMYRSSDIVTFDFVDYKIEEEMFIDENGDRLSDHYATSITIDYSLSDNIKLSSTFGGTAGDPFNFIEYMPAKPSKVSIRTGDRVDSVEIQYGDISAQAGGNGGDYDEIILDEDEYIVKVKICKDKRWYWTQKQIYYIKIETNKGKVLSGGTKSDEEMIIEAPEGWQIAGFYGKANAEICQLGGIFIPQ